MSRNSKEIKIEKQLKNITDNLNNKIKIACDSLDKNIYKSYKDIPITTSTKLMNTKPIEKPFSFLLFKKRITKYNPNSNSPNMVMPFITCKLIFLFIKKNTFLFKTIFNSSQSSFLYDENLSS